MSNALPNLEHYWMPFTGNRYFKKNPRMFKEASGMHYTTYDDKTVMDGVSGLWCCNAGHCHPKIVEAIQKQAGARGMPHPGKGMPRFLANPRRICRYRF